MFEIGSDLIELREGFLRDVKKVVKILRLFTLIKRGKKIDTYVN